MTQFNFNSMELSLLSAMQEAYRSYNFDADGGFLYFSLRNLLKNEVRCRLQDTIKREYLEDTVEQAMEAADEHLTNID